MFLKSKLHLSVALGALLLFAAPAANADRGGRHGREGGGRGYSSGRNYSAPSRNYYSGPSRNYYSAPSRNYYSGPRYVAPQRYYGGYNPGSFYSGRGYFYGGSFWARPYFGVGIGIPFGFGYRTNRGCGYTDGWGYWHPAPCYSGYGY